MSTAAPSQYFAGRMEDRLEFETLISDASAALFAVPMGRLDLAEAAVEFALERLRVFFQADRCALLSVGPDQGNVRIRVASFSDPDSSVTADIDLVQWFPWSHRTLIIEQKPVRITRVAELPSDEEVERLSWSRLPIRSALTLPLQRDGIVRDLILLNTVHHEIEWPDVYVTRLRVLGEVLVSALERQAMFVELRDSEERVNLAADSAEAGLWSLDFQSGVFWATERARAVLGYSQDEPLTVESVLAPAHPDDRDLVWRTIERSRKETDPFEVEYRIVVPGAGVRWVASFGRPHFTPAGEPDRLTGVSIDITENKQAEEALRRSEARLASGVELAGLAFYEVDFDAGTMYIDDMLRSVCGVPPDREEGLQPLHFWMEHLHPDDRAHILVERDRLQDGRADRLSVEYRYLHPALGQRWFHHSAGVAARDASGRAVRTYGVFRDITDRRQAEEALRKSLAEIEQLKDRLEAEGEYLKAEMRLTQDHGIVVGQSTCMRKLLHLVEQVAPTDSSVLVRGETGTGKELIAQAIHLLSPRRNNLIVKVNCAALPSGLVESELFGRERGAYTGAMTRQIGRFEVADGSTLFLDEIGELPLDLQSKLLRVLEAGEFERLGSPRTIKVNVRVIAATNRDLTEAIKQGKFREDLYYRLNVFPLHVPPLRDRAEDIPLLVWAFLEEFSSRMGKKINQVPRKTMEALQRHSWPGNVRELRNVIEHGAIITSGNTLRIPLLGDGGWRVAASRQTLAEVEREHILHVLERTGWHIKGPNGAAAELGLNAGTLYSRLKKLGIRPHQRAESGTE